ncbi:unnamed protein product [Pleuronectes platessa]|uniref:Uncharacterized protein n=1 Tax=Pleuronectes platessa TaxID=8262 RepID=A0A9N7USU3_PLEPL|nr:unnamed protein product [Pleuronectes platessa]
MESSLAPAATEPAAEPGVRASQAREQQPSPGESSYMASDERANASRASPARLACELTCGRMLLLRQLKLPLLPLQGCVGELGLLQPGSPGVRGRGTQNRSI